MRFHNNHQNMQIMNVWPKTDTDLMILNTPMSFLPRAMIFCFLCQFPTGRMVPYTSTSLKRKKDFGCHRVRPFFIRWPWPSRARPGLDRGCPIAPKEFSTALMRAEFSFSKTSRSIMMSALVELRDKSFRGLLFPCAGRRDFPAVV